MEANRTPVQVAMLLAGLLSTGSGYAAEITVDSVQLAGPPPAEAGAATAAPAAPLPPVARNGAAAAEGSAPAPGADARLSQKRPASQPAAAPAVSSHYVRGIQERHGALLGSSANIESLVGGLRNGTPIALSGGRGGPAVSFSSPAGRMGYTDITQTLSLVAKQFWAVGIAQPSPEELRAGLMGGTVTNAAGQAIALPGVLQLRSQGVGWGKIASTIGTRPETVSPSETAGVAGATQPERVRATFPARRNIAREPGSRSAGGSIALVGLVEQARGEGMGLLAASAGEGLQMGRGAGQGMRLALGGR